MRFRANAEGQRYTFEVEVDPDSALEDPVLIRYIERLFGLHAVKIVRMLDPEDIPHLTRQLKIDPRTTFVASERGELKSYAWDCLHGHRTMFELTPKEVN